MHINRFFPRYWVHLFHFYFPVCAYFKFSYVQYFREAARECRRKKKEYVKCLENRVAVLENQNKTLIEELKALKELYCQKEGWRMQILCVNHDIFSGWMSFLHLAVLQEMSMLCCLYQGSKKQEECYYQRCAVLQLGKVAIHSALAHCFGLGEERSGFTKKTIGVLSRESCGIDNLLWTLTANVFVTKWLEACFWHKNYLYRLPCISLQRKSKPEKQVIVTAFGIECYFYERCHWSSGKQFCHGWMNGIVFYKSALLCRCVCKFEMLVKWLLKWLPYLMELIL